MTIFLKNNNNPYYCIIVYKYRIVAFALKKKRKKGEREREQLGLGDGKSGQFSTADTRAKTRSGCPLMAVGHVRNTCFGFGVWAHLTVDRCMGPPS